MKFSDKHLPAKFKTLFWFIGLIPLSVISALVAILIGISYEEKSLNTGFYIHLVAFIAGSFAVISGFFGFFLAKFIAKPLVAIQKKLPLVCSEEEAFALQKASNGNSYNLFFSYVDFFIEKKSEMERALRKVPRIEAILESTNAIMWRKLVSNQTFSLEISEYWKQNYFGFCFLQEENIEKAVEPGSLTLFKSALSLAQSGPGRKFSIKIKLKISRNQSIWVNFTGVSAEVDGELYVEGLIIDINKQVELEAKVKELEMMYDFALSAISGIVYEVDIKKDEVLFTRTDEEISIFGDVFMPGSFSTQRKRYWELIHPDYREGFLDRFFSFDHMTMLPSKSNNYEYRLKTINSDYIWIRHTATVVKEEDGKALRVVGRIYNINESKRREQKLAYQSNHDSLTGTLLRSAIIREFNLMTKSKENPVGILVVDIDNFSSINNKHGHTVGDMVLTYVVGVLWKNQSGPCSVARIGGDEFVVLLHQNKGICETMEHMANGILSAFAERVVINGTSLDITVSIGMSICDEIEETFDRFFDKANLGLFQSKRKGKGCYSFYEAEFEKFRANAKDTISYIDGEIYNPNPNDVY